MANDRRQGQGQGQGQGQASDNGALRYNAAFAQDPTALTTEQLLRENFWLREVLEGRIDGIEARMTEGAKAVQLLQAFADRTPTTMDVQHEVVALREVVMEKFESVNTTFAQNGVALTAALQAQEKQAIATNTSNTTANNKMEDSFTKQIDSINDARKGDMKGVDDKLEAVKERLTIIESKTSISDPSTAITLAKLDATVARLTSSGDVGAGKSAGQAVMWALIVSVVGLMLALGTFIVMIMKFTH